MGMVNKRAFQQEHKIAAILKSTVLNSGGTATADVLKTPILPATGRLLSFLLNAIIAASSDLSAKLIGRKIADGNWEVVKDKAGADIAIPAAKLLDTAVLETGGIMATVDIEDMKSTYYEVGLRVANAAATDVDIAGFALWYDLFSIPSGQEDQLEAIVYA